MSSPKIPTNISYWNTKGKTNKVALYTHDDLDGIACAILMKNYLEERGFEIVRYGLLNYQEKFNHTTIFPELINIVLDFSSLPDDERLKYIDYYLDHHGNFSNEENIKFHKLPLIKKADYGSAFEYLCINLDIPTDSLIVNTLDMIDSAKYELYGVDWTRLLNYNLSEIISSKKPLLNYASVMNQFIKRSDTQTILEVIYNSNSLSILKIFSLFKILYELNERSKTPFIESGLKRINRMKNSISPRGNFIYDSYQDFRDDYFNAELGRIQLTQGYKMLGHLMYVPSGTYANALRARSVMVSDINDGIIPENRKPKFIMLQYGSTIQICSFDLELHKMESLYKKDEYNLSNYMSFKLEEFVKKYFYYNPKVFFGQDELTIAGGHKNISTISNIVGVYKKFGEPDIKYLDLFKNEIINDLSGIEWNSKLKWMDDTTFSTEKNIKQDHNVRTPDQLKRI